MAANGIKPKPVFPPTMQSAYMKLWVTIASSTFITWVSSDSDHVLYTYNTDVLFVYVPATNTAYVKAWLWRKFTTLGATEADIIDWLTPRMKSHFGFEKTYPINLFK
jgi:hypothetical protein